MDCQVFDGEAAFPVLLWETCSGVVMGASDRIPPWQEVVLVQGTAAED